MTSIEISPDTSVHPLIAALRQRARRLKYIATIYLGFILIALVSGGFLFYWLPQLLIGQEQKLIPLQNLSIEKGALEASIKFISSRWESQKGNAIADVTRKGSRITKIEFTSVHSVHFVTTQNGWAVGPRGTILSTTDGGKSWQNQASGTDNHLRSVHFVTAKNGWAVGLNGTIMSTIDGGKSWQSQTSGTDDNLYSVHFVTAQNGWAVGGDGTILSTIDGGKSWQNQASGTDDGLYSVHFVTTQNGWAVGWNGQIIHFDIPDSTKIKEAKTLVEFSAVLDALATEHKIDLVGFQNMIKTEKQEIEQLNEKLKEVDRKIEQLKKW